MLMTQSLRASSTTTWSQHAVQPTAKVTLTLSGTDPSGTLRAAGQFAAHGFLCPVLPHGLQGVPPSCTPLTKAVMARKGKRKAAAISQDAPAPYPPPGSDEADEREDFHDATDEESPEEDNGEGRKLMPLCS